MKKNKILYIMIVIFTMLLSLNTIANAAEAVAGSGTEKKPYIINMDNAQLDDYNNKYIEIPCENEKNFYFKIEGNNSNGTYCVKYEEGDETVKFIFISNENSVVYNRGSNGPFYTQAGTNPNAQPIQTTYENQVPFVIETKETLKGDKAAFYAFSVVGEKETTVRRFKLQNAPDASTDPNVPHPSYFVFVQGGTVKNLYSKLSETNCDGSEDYGNGHNTRARKISGVFSNTNIMELVLDPRSPRIGEPTSIVRYAKWEGNEQNPNVKDEDKYTVDIVYHFVTQEEEQEEQANDIEAAITKMLIRNW